MKLLFLFFITTQKKKGKEGFVLIYALAFGLFVLGIGLAMVLQAQNQAMVVTAQIDEKKQEKSLDAGLSQLQTFVDENRPLMKSGGETWGQTVTGTTPENLDTQKLLKICKSSAEWENQKQLISALSSGAMQPLDNSNSEFSLRSYQFDSSKNTVTALILVQNQDSASQLMAKFEVNTPLVKFPALWLYNQSDSKGTGNVFIEGDVWANNCQFPLDKVRFVTEDYRAKYVGQDFPVLPSLDAIAPRIPPSQQLFRVEDDFTPGFTDLSFPRPTDVPTLQAPDGTVSIPVYEYIVKRNIKLINKELKINTFHKGRRVKVIFYLLGSIQSGTKIKHLCGTKPECNPEDLIFIGYGGNQKMDFGESDIPAPEVCFAASDKFQAFVVAPGYRFGLKRAISTQDKLDFSGAAFVNSFDTIGSCGEDRSIITIKAAIDNSKLPEDFKIENLYPQIGNLISYQEVSLEFSMNSLEPEFSSDLFGIASSPVPIPSFRLAP